MLFLFIFKMYAFLTIKFVIHTLYYAHDKSITVKENNLK